MRKSIKIMKFLFSIIIFLSLLSFSSIRNNKRLINDIKIDFLGKNLFIDSDFIITETQNKSGDFLSIKLDAFNINKWEHKLSLNPYVEKINIYKSINGIVGFNIKERKPLLRVMQKTPFYLDKHSVSIPFSKKHSPRVPLYYGEFDVVKSKILISFIKKVNTHKFLKDEVVQIEYKDNTYSILLRSYPFEVVLGKLDNLENKFYKLETFCKYLHQEKKEALFSKVNLCYKNQVIVI